MRSDAPDVVIIGAGPAGLATALWCATLGLGAVVVERAPAVGGQLQQIPTSIENLPGTVSVEGPALAATLRSQVERAGVEMRSGRAAMLDATGLRVSLAGLRDALSPRAVVLATGVRRRALGVPGERELVGRGLRYNLGRDPEALRDRRVVVVGGGDDAFEHCHLAAPYARSVTLVHRSDRYGARPAMRARVQGDPRVTLRPFTAVESVEGTAVVEGLRVRGPAGAEVIEADEVLVCIGPEPMGQGFGVDTDARGYVKVDRWQRSSRAGVYAVGDLCAPESPTIATAFGHGATVAKVLVATLAGHPFSTERTPAKPGAREGTEGDGDWLSLRGLSFSARIGVYPRERERRQALSFDIAFEVDAGRAAPQDQLRGTIDYAAVADSIEEVLARQHYNLIETVADTVARSLLDRFPTRRVEVRVTKPGVPQRHARARVTVRRERG